MFFTAAASGVLLPVLAMQLAKKRGATAMARAHSIDSIRSCVLFRDDVVVVVVVSDCGWSSMLSLSLSLVSVIVILVVVDVWLAALKYRVP